MHPKEVLFRISLYGGIIMVLLGLFMLYGNVSSEGFTYSRNGGSGTGSLTGEGAVSLGIATLLFSASIYVAWKSHVKESALQRGAEDAEINRETAKKAKRQQRAAYLKKFGS